LKLQALAGKWERANEGAISLSQWAEERPLECPHAVNATEHVIEKLKLERGGKKISEKKNERQDLRKSRSSHGSTSRKAL